MANNINNITVLGNLTRDPELRYTPNGNAVAGFGIAVNRRIQNDDGEWIDDPDFFEITTWFKLAENSASSLSKGDRVLVSGRLKQDRWEDKDGQKRSVIKIVASVVAPSLEFASATLEKNPRVERDQGQEKATSKSSDKNDDQDIDFTDDDIPF